MLSLKFADMNHVEFIISVQELPHVKQFIRASDRNSILSSVDNSDEAYLIAIDGIKGPIGFAYLRGMQNPNQCVELCKVAIGEPGFGYGNQFLPLILSHAFNERQKHRVWLDVFPDNSNARHLYKKHGFVEEGVMREAYLWGEEFRSAILMSLLATEFHALDFR